MQQHKIALQSNILHFMKDSSTILLWLEQNNRKKVLRTYPTIFPSTYSEIALKKKKNNNNKNKKNFQKIT